MRLGLIARADNGGLGNLTWEFARHMRPDRVVIMDLGSAGRGPTFPERYADFDTMVCHGVDLSDAALKWLLDGSDVVYTAETAYRENFWGEARARGVKTVLHSMPELHRPALRPDVLWLPTTYETRRFDHAGLAYDIVPVPVADDRFLDPADYGPVFYHLGAPAMLDRNGTDTVVEALQHVTVPCRVIFHSCPDRFQLAPRIGLVDLEIRRDRPDDYWRAHPADASVLVLPRRYAGLSLPMQEAMAAGRPVISTALSPQKGWPGVVNVPVKPQTRRVPMAGGVFTVYQGDPVALAHSISTLAENPAYIEKLSLLALEHADRISWSTWGKEFRARFEALV